MTLKKEESCYPNTLLNWADTYLEILDFKNILKYCEKSTTMKVVSGVVNLLPRDCYLSYEFVPLVEAGFSFNEICTVLKSRIVLFENQYGEALLKRTEINSLKSLVYKYNNSFLCNNEEVQIRKSDSSQVLHYLLLNGILLDDIRGNSCSLVFTLNENKKRELVTNFNEGELIFLKFIKHCLIDNMVYKLKKSKTF